MDSIQKVKTLYKSGRFQCDQFFYNKLYQIANELNLYNYLQPISKNKQIVQRAAELTKRHLITLQQQDDEQKALEIIHEINKNVKKIDTRFVKDIFQEIDALSGKSYETRIILYIKSQPYKKMYLQIFDRFFNSMHDPQLRLHDMLIVGLFFAKNHDKVNNFVQIYNNVLENGVNELKKFKQNYQFIKQNRTIQQDIKVNNYLKGTPIILDTLLRFNQVYKLISGDNKYGLKLNALKKDIISISQNHGNHGTKREQQKHRHRPVQELKKFLLNGGSVPNYCSLCLTIPQDHIECRSTIKILYHQKQQ